MMARFFFRLIECGSILEDEEGRDLPEERIAEVATQEARTIMCDEVRHGRLCLTCHIDVLDSDRRLVLTVPFQDVINISGYEPRPAAG